jgi:predicted ATPase
MINNIKIKNFKALRDIDIKTENLNVFTGLNGMGKSTILQALILLRQSSKNSFEELILNDIIELGTFKEIFCEYPLKNRTLSFELLWDKGEKIFVSREYDKNQSEEKILMGSALKEKFQNKSLFGDSTFKYLSAHRIKPQDAYKTNISKVKNGQLGNEGEFAPHYYHINSNEEIAIKELSFDEDDTVFSLEHQLNRWLSVISPKIRVHTENIDGQLIRLTYSYETKDATTSKFTSKNVGFGLTYVFSVLVAILSAKKGDIIIIENPESHIHPKGQTELARLMALAAKNGVQIFCETHSDHIIYGVRIAIKEHDISKDETRIYYIDRDKDEHFSVPHHVVIDKDGRMDRKSKEFFLDYENHLDKLLG